MYLIDTNIFIDFLKKRGDAVEILNKLKPYERGTSVVCIGELWEGLAEKKKKQFVKLIKLITVYNVDLKVVIKFAEIRKNLRIKGNLIDNLDILIAATCLANDLVLITNNLKHFERIEGLKILKK